MHKLVQNTNWRGASLVNRSLVNRSSLLSTTSIRIEFIRNMTFACLFIFANSFNHCYELIYINTSSRVWSGNFVMNCVPTRVLHLWHHDVYALLKANIVSPSSSRLQGESIFTGEFISEFILVIKFKYLYNTIQ